MPAHSEPPASRRRALARTTGAARRAAASNERQRRAPTPAGAGPKPAAGTRAPTAAGTRVAPLAGDGTGFLGEVLRALVAAGNGNRGVRLPARRAGIAGEIARAFNALASRQDGFADELARVADVVRREGRTTERLRSKPSFGSWAPTIDATNALIDDLVRPTTEVTRVISAVAEGDLTQKVLLTIDGRPARGDIAEIGGVVNSMVDQLRAFSSELTRVAHEVGTEGHLGVQADVKGVFGIWRDLTGSVNSMAANLTDQVRDIALVTTAVANGDLSQKVTVDVRGELLELKQTVNSMVDQLRSFAHEVTRVAREVGTEGRLGGQAEVKGVSGTWKDLTDSVNQLAGNLTSQVRNIAQVTTAVAKGDLSQKISVHAQGEVAELKDTINTMVDQLSAFAAEVTRVAREVGTEGRLGGQAEVTEVSGTWKDLTDNVNLLAGNLTSQVRNIAQVTTAVARGDLSQKITVNARGEVALLKATVNTMVDQLSAFADEVTRVAREVGTEGRLGGQAIVPGVSGTWKDLTDNVNLLAGNLTSQVRNIAQVTTAVARGDLSQKITVEVRGELLELKETVNQMVDQLSSFAAEVTRVAREVGTEGRLGGQAEVKGVSGTWRDLTASVNSMADNLTDQVRNIAQVTTAVAKGDLSQKITVPARGEILELKDTINQMVDQLSSFAAEVTRVAREVGTEGRLGGQAEVEGVSGTWARLTENVNQLAGNLTSQVRAIAEVATAVTAGDLTRQISIVAPGELGDLKDNINQMIENLRATTSRNEAQDWLNSNLARISATMQGQRNIKTLAQLIMSELTPLVGAQVGALYLATDAGPTDAGDDGEEKEVAFELTAGFGVVAGRRPTRWRRGEGLVGQCALERKPIVVDKVPRSGLRVRSGLVDAAAFHVVVVPVLFEERVLAVLELAALEPLAEVNRQLLHQIVETVGVALNTILATTRTEELLAQSQELTRVLQTQSAELQTKQEELQHTNAEIELARGELEERAEQLAQSSRYKSEFLANMSHELRTPLNSLLILARMLAENAERRLSEKEVSYAQSIYESGNDLLGLIDDILDLSRVEAGKLEVVKAPTSIAALCADVRQIFEPIASQKELGFDIVVDDDVPASVVTDRQRVGQVLTNLLSNACKFTEQGSVELHVGVSEAAGAATRRLALVVSDTGIGIAPDKQQLIFEAFQQADGTTSRRYGGTGLGLSISREIAHLLGGELRVESRVDEGSTFTLLLPLDVAASPRPSRPRRALEEQRRPVASGWEGTRVIVVDDDVRNLYALASALEARGMTVFCAGSGEQCLKLLATTPGVDMLLVDIMMPEMDGYETIRRIRSAPERASLPIIAVTAKAMEADREASLAAGASDYITKPVDLQELLRLMRVWLNDSE